MTLLSNITERTYARQAVLCTPQLVSPQHSRGSLPIQRTGGRNNRKLVKGLGAAEHIDRTA